MNGYLLQKNRLVSLQNVLTKFQEKVTIGRGEKWQNMKVRVEIEGFSLLCNVYPF